MLALSQDALAEGLDAELSQALLDEVACLSQQVSILKANLPPLNTRPTSKRIYSPSSFDRYLR